MTAAERAEEKRLHELALAQYGGERPVPIILYPIGALTGLISGLMGTAGNLAVVPLLMYAHEHHRVNMGTEEIVGQVCGGVCQTWLSCVMFTRVVRASSSAIRHPPSAIRHPPSAIRHPPSAIRHPPSAIRHPPSIIRRSDVDLDHHSQATATSMASTLLFTIGALFNTSSQFDLGLFLALLVPYCLGVPRGLAWHRAFHTKALPEVIAYALAVVGLSLAIWAARAEDDD